MEKTVETKKNFQKSIFCRYNNFFCLCCFIVLLFATNINASAKYLLNTSPKREVRAVWLTTLYGLDWPKTLAKDATSREKQKEELMNILDQLQQLNINTVLFQTRIRGTVCYPSDIEPFDAAFTGKKGRNPGYDPLQFAIEECHKRGMELHAWFVCLAIRGGYRDPALSLTSTYIASVAEEIVRHYDVDGLSLDYIRYPEELKVRIPHSQARENITRIVRAIHSKIKHQKPWVRLSCSPIGKYRDSKTLNTKGWNAYDKGMQDVELWIKEGLMDQVYPMMYFQRNNFDPFVKQWREISNESCNIIPGLGIYFLDPHEGNMKISEVNRQLNFLRNEARMGFCLFRTKYLLDNVQGIRQLVEKLCPYPVLTPRMRGKHKVTIPPKNVNISYTQHTTSISWQQQPDCFVNVYASREYPVDTSNPSNLIAPRVREKGFVFPFVSRMYYAITTMDRYGNESESVSLNIRKHKGFNFFSPHYNIEVPLFEKIGY